MQKNFSSTLEMIAEHQEMCEEAKALVKKAGITGPWDQEPNRLNWKHRGLDCMLVRHTSLLHWCGYVGVPPSHPMHGKNYDDVPAEVHGGLTFADKCGGPVCHVPEPGQPEDLWWLGFDCAHSGDLSPGIVRLYKENLSPPPGWAHGINETYKPLAYVKAETEALAFQLADL